MEQSIPHPLKKEGLFLLFLSLAALAFRLVYLCENRSNPFFDAPVVDAQAFLEQARQIAAGNYGSGSEPFWQPPFYPYFLALFCWLFPEHYFVAIRLVQSLLGTASCILVYLVARPLARPAAARIAAGSAAAYSVFIYFEGELLAVPLEIFLDLLLLHRLLSAVQGQRRRDWVASGAIGGLASLTRPNILLFIGTFLLWVSWRDRRRPTLSQRPSLLQKWLMISLPLVLVILPVTLRNYFIGHDAIFISANSGVNFYIGNNAAYDSTVAIHPGMHWEELVMEPVRAGFRAPSARSAFFFRKAFAFILDHPLGYGALLLKKLWLFWSGPEIKRNQDIYYSRHYSLLLRLLLWDWGIAFPFGLIGPLSLVGLGLSWRCSTPSLSLLRLYALSYMGSVLLFFVTDRYRAPVVPVLMIFAAWAAVELFGRVRRPSRRSLLLPGISFLILVFLLNLRSASAPERDAQLYHDLGEVHLRKRDYPQAVAHSQRALELEEPYPSAHHNLAVAYLHQQRYEEAIYHARRAVELSPLYPDPRVVLAQAYMATGAPEEAGRQLQHALEIAPDLGPAHYYYGHLLLKQRRWVEAIPHLLAASRWEPGDFWLHYELAQAYQASGQLDQALRYLRQAQALDPRRPEALNAIGAVYLLQQNYEQARSYFEQALVLDPENPEALTNLGWVDLQARRFQDALLHFQRALPRAADPRAAYRGLLQAYAATGQKERVREVLEKLRTSAPAP